jgi:GrpB-like predicted nucleotidyltransferase (UPF0157 family)
LSTPFHVGTNILSAMADPIIVVDYDPSWPERFLFLQRRIAGALGSMGVAIEHVGSTAVPNVPAKPIIDIDVLLATETEFDAVIDRLAKLGYVHQGNLGIPEREAFAAPVHDVPHHLYVCPPGSRTFQKRLAFRDYLRARPREAKVYADLKRSLALQFRDDRPAYTSGKSAFVAEIFSRAMSAPAG